jgi:hypothetical protein
VSQPFWWDRGTPADRPIVLVTCPAGPGTDVLVQYQNGELWCAGPDTPGTWVPFGTPPGNDTVGIVAGFAAAHGSAALAVGGTDGRIWVTTGRPGWTDLGSPGGGGLRAIAAVEDPGPPAPTRIAAAVDWTESLWVRVDPAVAGPAGPGSWEQVTPPSGTVAAGVAALVADASPGRPAGHLVVTVQDPATRVARLAVLTRREGTWQWTDPGPVPGSIAIGVDAIAAGAVAGPDGLRGYAAVDGFDTAAGTSAGVLVLHSAGTAWAWSVIGKPPGDQEWHGRSVAGIPDPATGAAAPAVLVVPGSDSDTRLWCGSLDGTWTPIGSPVDGAPVWTVAARSGDPAAAGPLAVVAGDGPSVHELRLGPAGAVWTEHPAPTVTVADVAGGLADWDDPTSPEPGWHAFTVGSDGRLWGHRWNGRIWSWSNHGRPAPDVAAVSGVGAVATAGDAPAAHVVVTGADGGVWHRGRTGGAYTWLAHGTPDDQPVRGTAAPVLVPDGPAGRQPHLLVWGRDGQVWARTSTAAGWQWIRRGAPPGATVFGLVGAVAAPAPAGGALTPVGFVITDAGEVWGSWPEGDEPRWTGLGRPAPGLAAVAGVGTAAVAAHDGGPTVVRVFVLDGTQRHLRVATWPPGPAWADVAPLPGAGIAGSFGAVSDPNDPTSALVFVPGSDGHLWTLRYTAADAAWQDWGALPTSGRARGRATVAAMQNRSPVTVLSAVAPVRSDDGRLVIAWPG